MPNTLDVTGHRYGKLTAIEFVGSKQYKGIVRRVWRWKCDCGEIVERTLANVRHGDTKSCGCQKRNAIREIQKQGTLEHGEASFNVLFAHYQNAAKSRNLSWGLSKEKFRYFTAQNCYYCGVPPYRRYTGGRGVNGEYIYNGIDRVDNLLGYEENNIVTCCFTCNRAKHTMSQQEFLEWIDQLIAFRSER